VVRLVAPCSAARTKFLRKFQDWGATSVKLGKRLVLITDEHSDTGNGSNFDRFLCGSPSLPSISFLLYASFRRKTSVIPANADIQH
jgi:hypothetical protein